MVAAAGVATRKGLELVVSLLLLFAETTQLQALGAQLWLWIFSHGALCISMIMHYAVVAMFIYGTARAFLYVGAWFQLNTCAGGGANAVNAGHGRVRTAAASALLFAVFSSAMLYLPELAAVVWVSTDPAFLITVVLDTGSILASFVYRTIKTVRDSCIICVSGFAGVSKYIGARYTTVVAASDADGALRVKLLHHGVVAMSLRSTARAWLQNMCACGGANAVSAGHGRVRTLSAGSGITHGFKHSLRTIGGYIKRTGLIGTLSGSILAVFHRISETFHAAAFAVFGSGYTTGEAGVRSASAAAMAFQKGLITYICGCAGGGNQEYTSGVNIAAAIGRRLNKAQMNITRGAAFGLVWIAACSWPIGVGAQSPWNNSSSNATSPSAFLDPPYDEDGGLAAKWGPWWRVKLVLWYLAGLAALIGLIYLADWFFSRVCGGAGPDDDAAWLGGCDHFLRICRVWLRKESCISRDRPNCCCTHPIMRSLYAGSLVRLKPANQSVP